MSRFLRDPSKMARYAEKDLLKKLSRNLQHSNVLVDKFYQFSDGAPNIYVWRNEQPNRNRIVNYRYARNSGGRIVGIYYQVIGGDARDVYRRGDKDFLQFIANSSNGLTKTGQLLFQQSVESYVYCVLGAQARTRWSIVGRGAMSLQTQEVFGKLAADTIIQNDQTVAVSNMRKAIKDTNVVLNMAISPGIILVPSDMIILTEMIAGYNNILTLARQGMRFGENDGINRVVITPEVSPKTSPKASKVSPSAQRPKISNRTEDGTEGDTKGSAEGSKGVYKPTAGAVVAMPSKPQLGPYLLVVAVVGGSLISRFVV